MRAPLRVLIVLLGTALSGCADSGKGVASTTSTSAAPPATVGADTGGIEGTVADDEALPLSGVEVALVQTAATTRSDAEGRFSFSELQPGQYTVAFQRLGYESAAKKVSVVAGEVTQVSAMLAPIAVVEPYPELLIYDGYIRYGQAVVDIVTSSFDLPGCEKCVFNFNATADTLSMVFEISFTPTITNPTGPTKLGYQIWDEGTNTNYAGAGHYWASGSKRQLDRDTAKWPDKGQAMYWLNYCDLMFVCLEQKFTGYLTLFHNGLPEDDYTALPK